MFNKNTIIACVSNLSTAYNLVIINSKRNINRREKNRHPHARAL